MRQVDLMDKAIDYRTYEKECNKYLYVIPSKAKYLETIFLTESKSAWITIEWLSEELMVVSQTEYSSLFDLHPTDKGKVVLYGHEIQSPRWHKSYLKTPPREAIHTTRSYMYSGKEEVVEAPLPILFEPYLDLLNSTQIEDKYNQVIVNWYQNGHDFIAAHSDCVIGMKPHAGIAILSLYENARDERELIFTSKKVDSIEQDAIYSNVRIRAPHGSIITMHGDTQQRFRHKVPKALDIQTSRISITFRKF